ncbi:MAG: CvpA family protein [Gloeobacteraceae cyanobacterium ES-bin-316]|nr:CvpA family protein [Ferruginibacter sp.]
MFIDIVFFLLMLLACIKGFSKGLIVALFSIVGFIAGLAAALKLSAYAAEKLSGTFNASGRWLPFVSFLLVFILVVILVNLGARLLQKSVELIMLGWVNRLGGALLYALLYSILLSIFLFYAVQLHFLSAEVVAASVTYPFLQPLGPAVINALGSVIPLFKDMFAQLQDFFGKIPAAVPSK